MTVPRDAVTAVVLVGGRSTRMGRDKATLVPDDGDGRTLTQRVIDALAPVAATQLLAGRAIPGLDVAAIPDRYPEAGPLGGVASALDAVGTDLAVVAACDMPNVAAALVDHLLQRCAGAPDAQAVLCRSTRGLEPLLSVWRPATAAPHLHAALDGGTRALHDAIATLPRSIVVEPEEWRPFDPAGASFVNWNRPADLP